MTLIVQEPYQSLRIPGVNEGEQMLESRDVEDTATDALIATHLVYHTGVPAYRAYCDSYGQKIPWLLDCIVDVDWSYAVLHFTTDALPNYDRAHQSPKGKVELSHRVNSMTPVSLVHFAQRYNIFEKTSTFKFHCYRCWSTAQEELLAPHYQETWSLSLCQSHYQNPCQITCFQIAQSKWEKEIKLMDLEGSEFLVLPCYSLQMTLHQEQFWLRMGRFHRFPTSCKSSSNASPGFLLQYIFVLHPSSIRFFWLLVWAGLQELLACLVLKRCFLVRIFGEK